MTVVLHRISRNIGRRIRTGRWGSVGVWLGTSEYERRLATTTSFWQQDEDSKENPISSPPSSISPHGLYRLLTQEERELLNEQRQLTEASRQIAFQLQGSLSSSSSSSSANLDRMLKSTTFLQDLRLDSTFSVVIAGEFNVGKSTLINALLGSKLLETGALPTTDCITVVAAAAEAATTDQLQNEYDDISDGGKNIIPTPLGVIVHSVKDLPILDDLTLIDSPGTNSTWMDHTERTLKVLPSADLIVFVTSAERPFSESERTLLQSIQAYRKNIVVVINKMDVLDTSGGDHGQEQKQAVVDFVTDKASEMLGARPLVIPVSSKDAFSAKLLEKSSTKASSIATERSSVYQRSNFAALESFLRESLTTQTKVKSKLSNPIGVVEGVMTECLRILENEQKELQVDVATLNIFQSQFEGWKKEIQADLAMSRQSMSSMVRQEGQRYHVLLNRIKKKNPFTLLHWTILNNHPMEEEWHDTKQEVCPHRHKSLKEDLMEQVHETA
jgi:small GTP-binding protein